MFYATWSPDSQTIAFVAYDLDFLSDRFIRPAVDLALYVTEFDGTPIRTIPISDDEPSRYQWLSDSDLAVTNCVEDSCDLHIYDVTGDGETITELGAYLLEGYVSTLDNFLLTSIGYRNKNIFLRETTIGEAVQFSHVDYLISRPLVSPDEKYIAYRADLDGEYKLFVDNLSTARNVGVIELQGERPDMLVSNRRDTFPYDFYFVFDDWHPDGDRLLFEDNNVVYIYDVLTASSEVAVAPMPNLYFSSPRWVC